MGRFSKELVGSKEERAAAKEERLQSRADHRAEREQQKTVRDAEREQREFEQSPVGQARAAHERGDQLFQCSIDVMNQQAVIVAMVGSAAPQRTNDPTAVLNAVAAEGWDLVNGSFVFVEQGQQSRDKFMASGQNVAIKGTTVGYYLFRRRS